MARRLTFGFGAFVLLLAAAVYLITLTPTVPFWDSGEFIAVSNILGIPHPPGTPFYVILGRIAALVPVATIAHRVNGLSALASALAVLLTYLTIVRLVRRAQGPERGAGEEWIAQLGGFAGALLLAFSDCFWENAIEAEVYALMSLAQVLVLWLGLRWWEAHDRSPTAGPLLVCVYVMWLSVGVHLGVGMMGLPLLLLVWLVDRRAALVFAMPMLSVLGVTFGLEKMAGVVLLFSTVTFLVYAAQGKLDTLVAWGGAIASLYGMYFAFGDREFTSFAAVVAVAGLLVPLLALARRAREGRILLLALGLMVIGYSTHAYLPIRARQHPAINEGNPANWSTLRDLLERKQYGRTSMFVRRAPLSAQLDKEFWRYWKRQWPVIGNLRVGGPVPQQAEPRLWQFALPLALGLAGAGWHLRRDRTSGWPVAVFVAFGTVGMIAFLNFSAKEVRDRDYFFTTGYHAFALWIGMGVAYAVTWVRDSFAAGATRTYAGVAAGVLLGVQPFLLLSGLWYFHDRRGNYVAHDYAYNMLQPLAPNSYVFTNGDNDTFPLWYMQEVENFRRDVRVVNLSLLNTDWYITQLRDQEPKVPITLNDDQIRILGAGAVQDSAGNIIYTSNFMVDHIVSESRSGSGWKKQPYFAVTVPEHMGLDPYFSLEGLVYRVNRDTLRGELDEPATRRNLYETFMYRGLFTADGSWDTTVFKDENASILSRNYMAAHVQLAMHYRSLGQLDKAVAEGERAVRMFPDLVEMQGMLGSLYLDAGRGDQAIALFRRMVARSPNNPESHYYLGVGLTMQKDVEGAVKAFDEAIRLDPTFADAYLRAAYALGQAGQAERSNVYLQRLAQMNPQDPRLQQLLRRQGAGPGGGAVPPPAGQVLP